MPLLDPTALAKALSRLMDDDEEKDRTVPVDAFGKNLPDKLHDFAVSLDGAGGIGSGGEGAPPPTCPGSGHPMTVMDTYEAFACDECGVLGEGERWHCAKCKADFCWSCRPAPTGTGEVTTAMAADGNSAGGVEHGTTVELDVGSPGPAHGVGLTLMFRYGSTAYRCAIPAGAPGEGGGAPTLTRLAKAPPRRGDLLPPTDKNYPARTVRDGEATMLTISNESLRATVGVYWVDRAGTKHKYAELKPNTS